MFRSVKHLGLAYKSTRSTRTPQRSVIFATACWISRESCCLDARSSWSPFEPTMFRRVTCEILSVASLASSTLMIELMGW